MPFRNSVTIVASPRPRVGKTLLARLLIDFNLHEGRDVSGFDLNPGEGVLAQFLPAHAAVAAIADIKGQMALFDRLIAEDGGPKVVDLGHESFAAFFAVAGKIGFAEEARRRAIAPAVLYFMTPDATSVEAYDSLRQRFPEMTITPVQNELFASPHRGENFPRKQSHVPGLRFPALALGLRRYIETPPFSFSAERLANLEEIPLDTQAELQRWLRKAYREFREFDLRVLLADLQTSLRLPS